MGRLVSRSRRVGDLNFIIRRCHGLKNSAIVECHTQRVRVSGSPFPTLPDGGIGCGDGPTPEKMHVNPFPPIREPGCVGCGFVRFAQAKTTSSTVAPPGTNRVAVSSVRFRRDPSEWWAVGTGTKKIHPAAKAANVDRKS